MIFLILFIFAMQFAACAHLIVDHHEDSIMLFGGVVISLTGLVLTLCWILAYGGGV